MNLAPHRGCARRTRSTTRVLLVAIVVALCPVFVWASPADAAYSSAPTSTWGVNGTVLAMASHGNVTYLGGDFTTLRNPVTKATRPAAGLAAIDRTTGQPLAGFAASTNGTVRSLATSANGAMLYVGGTFTAVDGASASNLTAISPVTGARIPTFKSSASDTVRDLEVTATSLYVAGQFDYVDGAPRAGLAELDPTTGTLVEGWRPKTTGGRPFALRVSPNGFNLIVGGHFTGLNSAPRVFLGSVTLATGATTAWAPSAQCGRCFVFDVDASTSTVYAAIAGPGGTLNAYDSVSGAKRWSDHADGDVQAVSYNPTDNLVYAGGHFDTKFRSVSGAVVRHQLVAVNATTGATNSAFHPAMTTAFPGVWSVIARPETLLAGGGFTGVVGQAQPHYAQFRLG